VGDSSALLSPSLWLPTISSLLLLVLGGGLHEPVVFRKASTKDFIIAQKEEWVVYGFNSQSEANVFAVGLPFVGELC
jgi:hypothetical protein